MATGWSQPGQRYGFVAEAPGTLRTIQIPSLLAMLLALLARRGLGARRCLLGRRAMMATIPRPWFASLS